MNRDRTVDFSDVLIVAPALRNQWEYLQFRKCRLSSNGLVTFSDLLLWPSNTEAVCRSLSHDRRLLRRRDESAMMFWNRL